MPKKNKICLTPSQTERLMTDTAKLAKGIDDDICPTVREMYDENVPKDLRIKGKSKKAKKKEEEGIADWGAKKIGKKLGTVLDDLF